jgi:hypothetical protein
MRLFIPLIVFVCTALHAQNVIYPIVGAPLMDGVLVAGEWDQAPMVKVASAPGDTCRVALIANTWGLYIAFIDNLESAGMLFPEMLFDPVHDRTPAWNADDQWFHVSATNCHHMGAYGVYDYCELMPLFWSAHPNFSVGTPNTDSVEVAIPWTMLGGMPVAGDTIGLAFVLTNTVNEWHLWPTGASEQAPSTWGHLVFPMLIGIDEYSGTTQVRTFPVPATDDVVVNWDPRAGTPTHVHVHDAQGRSLSPSVTITPTEVRLRDLPVGSYGITLTWSSGARAQCTAIVVR